MTPAKQPMPTDEEILALHGDLFEEADAAFRIDVSYAIAMAKDAAKARARKDVKKR